MSTSRLVPTGCPRPADVVGSPRLAGGRLVRALRPACRALAGTALLAGAALTAGTAPAAAAPSKVCSKHTTEVARNGGSVLWTDKGKLWSCTVYGGRKPQNRQIGPWTKGSQVILGGATVGWTQRTKIGGKSADRVYAADLSRYAANPRFLSAAKPAVGPGSSKDLRVAALSASSNTVAWVTTAGRVVASFAGDVSDPKPLGAGTAAAVDLQLDGVTAGPGIGLLMHPTVNAGRVLIGQWTGPSPAELADTVEITNAGGEGDECGGSDEIRVQVMPNELAPQLGASFWVSTTNDGPAC